MKEAFWKSDRFVGLVISTLFFILWWGANPFLEGLEGRAYDAGVNLSSRDEAGRKDDIAVIAIDDQSIQNIGRWPWPRDVHATMLEKLTEAGAKVVASTVFFSEPQTDPGLMWINRLRDQLAGASLAPDKAAEINGTIAAALAALDTDSILGGTLRKTANTVLGMQFEPGEPLGNPDSPLPEYVARFAIPDANISDPAGSNAFPVSTIKAAPPVAPLGEAAAGIGSLINPLDVDGVLRREPLVVRYYDQYFPSLALMTAAKSLNLSVDDIKITRGEAVRLGNLEITTSRESLMNTFFYDSQDAKDPLRAFPTYSFYNVIQGETPLENFKGKIVLIGATAFGVGSTLVTPLGEARGPVMILAHTVASILNQDFFVQPDWGFWLELSAILLVAAYLTLALPKLNAGPAAIATIVLFGLLLGTELGLMVAQSTWVKLVTAATLLLVGHALMTTKRYLATERVSIDSSLKAALSNRQLALTFQQKGELDNAFEYFRRCPVDDELLEAMYGLATDYMVKRQPQKAMLVYEYIHAKNPKFRDIAAKIAQTKHATDTQMMFPSGAPGGAAAGTILLGPGMPKTMLGRYEVERELGKGAMGVVYLGRDPKINRVVAIKTMALAQEFEADEVEEVKQRFFREAETAGRLVHPNIVTIYDCGEEHDLAYIAMEFLEGHDLTRYTKPDSLLPLPVVMGIVFKAALALDAAHKQNIVHRDIKPANVMYEPTKKTVKLTDFGIARITDSSKTKTGMVLGTPSYMSPEQLSGKKVDGRSDLFSLGVMLYQMVTGKLPFQGESMATLMYRIANEPHQDIAELKPELAKQRPCLSAIINKALQKDVNKRYQSGAEMARDIQACAKQVGG